MREEIRRIYSGSVYWLRANGALWIVTADGAPISWPDTYDKTLEALNAVAPLS